MTEIWDELEADFERRRADGRSAHDGHGLTVVIELAPDTPDFDFIPVDGAEARGCLL